MGKVGGDKGEYSKRSFVDIGILGGRRRDGLWGVQVWLMTFNKGVEVLWGFSFLSRIPTNLPSSLLRHAGPNVHRSRHIWDTLCLMLML